MKKLYQIKKNYIPIYDEIEDGLWLYPHDIR